MRCKSCGLEASDGRAIEGKCESCYCDPEAIPVLISLGYIVVVLFLLVIVFL